jgi:hypothetical protein
LLYIPVTIASDNYAMYLLHCIPKGFQAVLNNFLYKCLNIQPNSVRVIVFNITFNNISVILWQKLEDLEKTTDLPQVTDKLYHIMPISLRVRILADKLFVLPSAGFEPTRSIHCSTHSLRIMINHLASSTKFTLYIKTYSFVLS